MTTKQQYADNAKQYATDIARRATKWYDTMHLVIAEGFPNKTPMSGEEGGSGKGGHGDPTYQATQQRQAQRATLIEAEGLIVEFAGLGKRLAELMARNPVDHDHEAIKAKYRCSGKIDPTCERIASSHHDPDIGTLISSDTCDTCYSNACPRCHIRPIEQYRDHCDACRKAIEREKAKAQQQAEWHAA